MAQSPKSIAPQPDDAAPVPERTPPSGGRWIRDPITGELAREQPEQPGQPETQAPEE